VGSGQAYAANAAWRWIQAEWPQLNRHRTTTISGTVGSGTTLVYLAASADGTTWRYWSGPLSGSTLVSVANQAAAEAAAVSLASITGSRLDLPTTAEARLYRLYFKNTTGTTTWKEYYPQRLVQADMIQAGAVQAIHVSAAAITADKLAAGAVTATTIAAGALDAKTITGSTIRTNATTTRLELNNTTFSVINSGVTRVQLDTTGLKTFSAAGVPQVEATTATDGALRAGAGRVTLDASGFSIDADGVNGAGYAKWTGLAGAELGPKIGTFPVIRWAARVTDSNPLELVSGATGNVNFTMGFGNRYDGAGMLLNYSGTNWSGLPLNVNGSVAVNGAMSAYGVLTALGATSDANIAFKSRCVSGLVGLRVVNNTQTSTLFDVWDNGDVNVGTRLGVRTAPDAAVSVTVNGLGTGTTTFSFAGRTSGGTNNLYVRDDGYVYVRGTIDVGGLNNRSDARLKANIAPIPDALATLLAIPARQWHWTTGGPLRYGPIAQEVEAVAPELVAEGVPGPGETLRPGERGLLSLRGDSLLGLIHGAIHQLAARIAALEAL
jgi:hypothetical protein